MKRNLDENSYPYIEFCIHLGVKVTRAFILLYIVIIYVGCLEWINDNYSMLCYFSAVFSTFFLPNLADLYKDNLMRILIFLVMFLIGTLEKITTSESITYYVIYWNLTAWVMEQTYVYSHTVLWTDYAR